MVDPPNASTMHCAGCNIQPIERLPDVVRLTICAPSPAGHRRSTACDLTLIGLAVEQIPSYRCAASTSSHGGLDFAVHQADVGEHAGASTRSQTAGQRCAPSETPSPRWQPRPVQLPTACKL